jgi:NhaP-type Na+/H+ or K+/H+ antiporter
VSLELGVGIVAIVVAAWGLVAGLLARFSVSSALSFVIIGALLGGTSLGIITESAPGTSTLSLLAEVTLALVLFSDASTVNIRKLADDAGVVIRLLAIGLPLTIITGTLLALGLFPGISFGLALLIAATLAPTDATLGQQVTTDRSVPARIRRVLNVESGLNDGIAAPIVTVAIALAVAGTLAGSEPLVDAVRELTIAAVLGSAVGVAGGWLLVRADARRWTSAGSRKLVVLALAMGAYFLAVGLEASGFIAAFFAGLGFGVGARYKAESAVGLTERLSVVLSIVIWLTFGLVIVAGHLIGGFDVAVVLYAVLALTVLRMIPAAVALVGERFDRVTVGFVGWFGPRGLASIVLALVGLEALEASGVSAGPLAAVVSWTVLLSVVFHGFSARPLAKWFGNYVKRLPDDSPEFLGDEEPRKKVALWTAHPGNVEDEPRRSGAS